MCVDHVNIPLVPPPKLMSHANMPLALRDNFYSCKIGCLAISLRPIVITYNLLASATQFYAIIGNLLPTGLLFPLLWFWKFGDFYFHFQFFSNFFQIYIDKTKVSKFICCQNVKIRFQKMMLTANQLATP